jgi:uncharacterized protein YndB with AHSA1/START domain
MRNAFTDEQTIAAPPEAVWARLTDWKGAPNWMPGVESMRADGPPSVGSVLHFTARGKPRTSTVTALTPGRTLTLRSQVGGVTADYIYSVQPTDAAGTTVRLEALVGTRGIMTLLAPVIRSAIAKEDGVQLARLKAWVEASDNHSAAPRA